MSTDWPPTNPTTLRVWSASCAGGPTPNYRQDRLVLVVPRGHALARRRAVRFEEAVEYDFVCLSKGTSLARRLQSETEALGRRLKIRIQVRSFDAMRQMVAAGMGVAILPGDAIQPHLRSMNLRQISLEDAWASRRLLVAVSGAPSRCPAPQQGRGVLRRHCSGARAERWG
jgi:DNA-binding transcriptional LysR family regulator